MGFLSDILKKPKKGKSEIGAFKLSKDKMKAPAGKGLVASSKSFGAFQIPRWGKK